MIRLARRLTDPAVARLNETFGLNMLRKGRFFQGANAARGTQGEPEAGGVAALDFFTPHRRNFGKESGC